MYWYGSETSIELYITKKDALAGCHSGQCDDYIFFLLTKKYISRQFKYISPVLIVKELKATGAWDDSELKDPVLNMMRVLWLACCDIAEETRGKR